MKTLLLAFCTLLAAINARAEGLFPHVSVNGCSGVIVRAAGSSPVQTAILLTNAHCLDFRSLSGGPDTLPPPGRYFHEEGRAAFLATILPTVQSVSGRLGLNPAKLLFASMSGTDLAVLELKETYATLSSWGVEAIPLAPAASVPGTPLRIEAGFYNRGFECELGENVALREGPYLWPRAFRLGRGCEIYPGVSGAPVLDTITGRLLGLANTHYSGNGPLCSFHNPCEIDGARESAGAVDQSYAVRIDDLAGCFATGSGIPNFTQPSCPYGKSHAH